MPSWVDIDRLIRNGEDAVDEGSINSILSAIIQRQEYLKSVLDVARAGEQLYIRNAQIEPDVAVGDFVYKDPDTDRYDKALVDAETVEGGMITLSASSYTVGFVTLKHTATTADILTMGPFEGIDLSGTVEDAVITPGIYNLSTVTPGKVRRSTQPMNIPVLHMYSATSGFLKIGYKDPWESHIHYQFDLRAVPAGTANNPGPGGTHEITVPDDTVEGWLPADDAVFEGRAPECAKFGYNYFVNDFLFSVFPPIPIESSYLEKDGIAVNLLPNGQAIIDQFGIWWTDDSSGNAPWDEAYDGGGSPPVLTDCEVDETMKLTLWFTKLMYKTAASVVTSLRPASGSAISVKDLSGGDAVRGDLQLDVDFNINLQEGTSGYQVIKSFNGSQANQGPVLEKIRSGSPETLQLVGPNPEIIGGSATGFYHGPVTLYFNNPNAFGLEGHPVEIGLNRVQEVKQEGTLLYYSFPNSGESSMSFKVYVPHVSIPEDAELYMQFWFLATQAGDLPGMDLSYLIHPEPDDECAEVPFTTTYVSLDVFPDDCTGLSAGNYTMKSSDRISVEAGDVVNFILARDADADSYPGDLGLPKMIFRVEGPEATTTTGAP